MPVITILITRQFEAVFAARACTCKLLISFLGPIGRNQRKSTIALLSTLKRAPFDIYRGCFIPRL